MLINSRVFH